MVHHEYNSVEYVAQEFAKCIGKKGDYALFRGVGFRAEHHSNRVDFLCSGGNYNLFFELDSGKMFAKLEAVVNGEPAEIFRGAVKIKRSQHGKISRSSCYAFFMDTIMDAIKTYVLSDSK